MSDKMMNDIMDSQMPARIRKAWALTCSESDSNEPYVSYFPTAGKAKYSFICKLDWWDDMRVAFMAVKCRRLKSRDIILPERMPECNELTDEQINIIKHTYASDHINMGYRNYYNCSTTNKPLMDLVSKSIMTEPYNEWKDSKDATFHLTKLGIEMARSLAPLYPLYEN